MVTPISIFPQRNKKTQSPQPSPPKAPPKPPISPSVPSGTVGTPRSLKTKLESDKQNKKKKEEEKKEEESSEEEENKDHEGSGKHEKKCPKGKKNCDCSNVKGRGKKNIGKKKRKESD